MQRKHLVWDWNGTLFNDGDVVLAATNDVFAPHGVTLTLAEYQRTFRRPIAHFYGDLIGREINDEEYAHFDQSFHAAYRRRVHNGIMTHDAHVAMSNWEQAGHTQSLLSLWRHQELVPLITSLGLYERFLRVDGRLDHAMGGKTKPLGEHLVTLGIDPAETVLVGDSLDDAAAAQNHGAQCILYGNTHPREILEETGLPVADSLVAAVSLALR